MPLYSPAIRSHLILKILKSVIIDRKQRLTQIIATKNHLAFTIFRKSEKPTPTNAKGIAILQIRWASRYHFSPKRIVNSETINVPIAR